jgi:pyrimidine deaminase RibD-like protein
MEMTVAIARQARAEDARAHPKVGAVLLNQGQLLASAFRGELQSGEHAEFTLLQKKLPTADVTGSVLFTTLEPCTARNHPKKPCTEWVAERGIECVFVGILDPDPRMYAQGITRLRQEGIRIEFFPADLREAIRADNADFIDTFHANPELIGEVSFNFNHNDGRYTIGHGELMFETHWSNSSNTSIHVYDTYLHRLGLAQGAKSFGEVCDAGVYDMTSRLRTVNEGEIVVFQNRQGRFAVARIVDVKARSHGDPHDSLTIEYRINPDGSPLFRE